MKKKKTPKEPKTKKTKTPKIKKPKEPKKPKTPKNKKPLKLPQFTPEQKKKLLKILGIVAILVCIGLVIQNVHKKKVDEAYLLADQILGTSHVQEGSPYIPAESPLFEQNFAKLSEQNAFGDALIGLVDEFTAVSQNNALYEDAQKKKTAEEQSAEKKDKDKKKKKDKKKEKEELQRMQDRWGREHNFEETAAALSKAVGILRKKEYINGDLYNSFSNFYNVYSTYILEKYGSVPAEEKDAHYKYEFATEIRKVVKELHTFNSNAGEFYRMEDGAVCTPAQVESLYMQAIETSQYTKDGETLARVLKDMKSFPYTKDKVPPMNGTLLKIFGEGATELATLQNGVGGYYDNPKHRQELAARSSIPYDEKGIHGDFYYLQDGHSYVTYRGKSLVEQQIDKAIQYHMDYALRMPEGGFIFVGKDKIQISSNPDVPFIEDDFSEVVQQLGELYASGGLPKPAPKPIPVEAEPKKEPAAQKPPKKEAHDARDVQEASKKYRGEVVGKLDTPND